MKSKLVALKKGDIVKLRKNWGQYASNWGERERIKRVLEKNPHPIRIYRIDNQCAMPIVKLELCINGAWIQSSWYYTRAMFKKVSYPPNQFNLKF